MQGIIAIVGNSQKLRNSIEVQHLWKRRTILEHRLSIRKEKLKIWQQLNKATKNLDKVKKYLESVFRNSDDF